MARKAVKEGGVSVALACRTFGVSESCYRYEAMLSDENAEIADWLIRLTATYRTWGFGLCFLYLRNVKGKGWNGRPPDLHPVVDYKICDDDGQVLPTVEAGVIYLKGEMIMSGHLNQPEDAADVLSADGWLKTNDIGRIDENGYVSFLDRRNFLINTGGVNVFPA